MKKTKTIGLLLLLCSVVMAGGEREKFTLHSKGSDSAPVVFESNEADGSFELVNKSGVLQIKTLGNKDVLITGVKDGGQETAISEQHKKIGPYCLPALKIIKGSTGGGLGGGGEGTFDEYLEGWNEAINAGQLYAVWMDLSNQIKGVVFDDSNFITKSGDDGKHKGRRLCFDGNETDANGTHIVSSLDGKDLILYSADGGVIKIKNNNSNRYLQLDDSVFNYRTSSFLGQEGDNMCVFNLKPSGQINISGRRSVYIKGVPEENSELSANIYIQAEGNNSTIEMKAGDGNISCSDAKLINVGPADLPQF